MEEILSSIANAIAGNPWLAPIAALVSGVLTSLMPCSLSTVPLIIGYVGGSEAVAEGGKATRRAFLLSLLFALGMTIVFCVLGMLASALGELLEDAELYLHIVMGILLVLMALQMWDVINIIPSSSSMLTKNRVTGALGAFISGLIAGLFASHCALPAVIALMAVATNAGGKGLAYGPLLLLVFSIGHAVLSVVAGTSVGFVQKLMASPKYERVSKIIRIILGIIIMLFALYLFYEAIHEGLSVHNH